MRTMQPMRRPSTGAPGPAVSDRQAMVAGMAPVLEAGRYPRRWNPGRAPGSSAALGVFREDEV